MTKYKIIIIENDEDERFFMQEGFEASKLFDILAVLPNGDDLGKYLLKHQDNLPDLILSDLNMPGKNGFDVITEVTSSPVFSHIPVIITSTSSTKTIMDKCLAMGAADYLVKPDTFINYVPYANSLYKLLGEKNWLVNND